MEAKFYSITKFVDYFKTTKLKALSTRGPEGPHEQHQPSKVILWFEPDRTFTNKYKQYCIKPIALTLSGDKSLTLTHKTLLDEFDNVQPIISFTKSKLRSIAKIKKERLAFLSIKIEQNEFDCKVFYPSQTGTTENAKVIKKILDSKVNEELDEDIKDIEEELVVSDFI